MPTPRDWSVEPHGYWFCILCFTRLNKVAIVSLYSLPCNASIINPHRFGQAVFESAPTEHLADAGLGLGGSTYAFEIAYVYILIKTACIYIYICIYTSIFLFMCIYICVCISLFVGSGPQLALENS